MTRGCTLRARSQWANKDQQTEAKGQEQTGLQQKLLEVLTKP